MFGARSRRAWDPLPTSGRVIAVVVVAALLSMLLAANPAAAQGNAGLVVNELVADNGASLTDEDNDSPDWIELANPTGSAIDLTGMYLTDSALLPTQWQFPAGTTIPAGSYLIVFASSKDRAIAGQPLHTNFKLTSAGEDVVLFDTDGVSMIDSITFPALAEDEAFGLFGGAPVRLLNPTPGATNSGASISSVDITASGTFVGSQTVTMSPTGDGITGTVRYTLDGSAPNATSTAYSGPVTVTTTTVIRARSFVSGSSGPEAYGVYTLASGLITSTLPIVVVDTFGQAASTSTVIDAAITVIENTNGVPVTSHSSLTTVKIRGSSSSSFPKKQYKLELQDAAGDDLDADLLGMGIEEDWILYAPGRMDRNFISNPLAQRLAGEAGLDQVEVRFVEVYFSDNGGPVDASDYDGIYILMETIKIDDERIDIKKLDATDNAEPAVTGGYIVSIDRADTGQHNFATQLTPTYTFSSGIRLNVVRPKLDDLTSAQTAYIEGYLTSFETALYGPNFGDPAIGYAAYIDVPSFIDTHILRYLSKDPDFQGLSTYFIKERGEKLRSGPVWDQDRGFESADTRDDEPEEPWDGTTIDPLNDAWWGRLFDDPAFRSAYVARWNELRTGILSDNAVQAHIDDLEAEISAAYGREDARWGSTSGYGSRFGGLGGEIDHLKDWLTTRSAFLDATLNEMLLNDLAEGQPATQSSTGSGAASRAVDGDTNGRFAGNVRQTVPAPNPSITATTSTFQPWWEVDLGSVQSIGEVRLWNRLDADCCADRLSDFHVFVSNVPFTSSSVAGTQAQAGVTDLAFAGTAGRTELLAVNRPGRYVRVQLAGTNVLSLAEVEVFEEAAIFYGDVDCNGTLNVLDAVAIAQYTVSLRAGVPSCPLSNIATSMNLGAADTNFDGVVNVLDAVTVSQCVAGLNNVLCP